MIYRILFFIIFLYSLSFASYEKVSIGYIDSYYNEKITPKQLYNIILEIENEFETKLNKNIFDYASDGRPIELVHLPASKLEKKIEKLNRSIEKKKNQIEKTKEYFSLNSQNIKDSKIQLKNEQTILDKKIEKFNNYVQSINSKKTLKQNEYDKAKAYVKTQKELLQNELKILNKKKLRLQNDITKYNGKISTYNFYIKEYNRLVRNLEELNRGYAKIKGRTFGLKKITTKTYVENGTKKSEKTQEVSMNKIEIYGFGSLGELKAILAHEIAHLVGIPHIPNKGALMNPILQQNQINNLSLTIDDINAFKKYF